MDDAKAFATSPTFRRLLVFIFTALAALLHRKFGLEVSDDTIDWLVALALAYITGSNFKDAMMAKGRQAPKPINTVEDAAAELARPLPTEGGK